MMKNIAVIYKTVYGTTRRYAQWISQELDAALLEAPRVKPVQLMDFDVVVYGGGLYAGGIDGVRLVAENPCKALVVFTVGLATPDTTDYSDILLKNFSAAILPKIKVFHLQGGMDYGRLSFIHRAMMAVKKKEVVMRPLAERTSDDHMLLETYGKTVDFTDREKIKPLVEYVKML